jgi:mRNA-degrading endonuclease toxin of MazEF toxin-antitoxin module
MKQAEIWELYLDPVLEREQGGRRPAVIISGNLLNQYLEVVIVCPLTTSISCKICIKKKTWKTTWKNFGKRFIFHQTNT